MQPRSAIRIALLCAVITIRCALAKTEGDGILGALRQDPQDKPTLAKLKGVYDRATNSTQKARYGVIYYLGCLTVANHQQAELVAFQLQRMIEAEPNNKYLMYFSREYTHVACPTCKERGFRARLCPACEGNCKCPMCDGKGYKLVRSGGRNRKVKCNLCHKTGQCAKCRGRGNLKSICRVCGGTGDILSKAKFQKTYHDLLDPALGKETLISVPNSPNPHLDPLGKLASSSNQVANSSKKAGSTHIDADALHTMGSRYWTLKRYAKAVECFRKAALQGKVESMHVVGLAYFNGQGVPKSFSDAHYWFSKGAQQKSPPATHMLGIMFLHGRGVKKNVNTAAKWIKRAAELNDVNAQLILGLLYMDGEGVPQNPRLAEKWWGKAAAQGSDMAKQNLRLWRNKTKKKR